MSTFSKKFGYDKRAIEPIIEDAPEWTRNLYIEGILPSLLYVDGDSRYKNQDVRPIPAKSIHRDLCLKARTLMTDEDYDSWYCIDRLKEKLRVIEWYHFYDFIELVGVKLLANQDLYSFEPDKLNEFGFNNYRQKVNDLFQQDNIQWHLNEQSNLVSPIPSVMQTALTNLEGSFTVKFEPARNHYRKSFTYLFQFPIDLENSVKEMVSSIESVGRTIFPKSSTLGDVIKQLKSNSSIPNLLVSIIDKFYVFSNASPAIRHGSNKISQLDREEAKFIFYVGIALIKYLIALDKSIDNSNKVD